MSRVVRVALVLLVLWAVPAAAQTVVFQENCLNNTGAALPVTQQDGDHSTPTGTSPFWTEDLDEGTSVLQARGADDCELSAAITSGAAVWLMVPNGLGTADYDVLATLAAVVNGSGDDDHFGVGGRYTDTAHFYALSIDGDTAPVDWRIIKRNGTAINAGAATVIASGTTTFTAGDIAKLSFRGDTIKAFRNGLELGCVVDADLTAQGSPALLWGDFSVTSAADASSTWRPDTIIVQTDTGLTDDNCGAAGGPPAGSLGTLGAGK
jgi:hypothetical protein